MNRISEHIPRCLSERSVDPASAGQRGALIDIAAFFDFDEFPKNENTLT
jgi:hypothetical protein